MYKWNDNKWKITKNKIQDKNEREKPIENKITRFYVKDENNKQKDISNVNEIGTMEKKIMK